MELRSEYLAFEEQGCRTVRIDIEELRQRSILAIRSRILLATARFCRQSIATTLKDAASTAADNALSSE